MVMGKKLSNIVSLGEWSELFIKPTLAHINSAIKNFNMDNVAYSRIEVDLREDIYNWNISTVCNKAWKKSEEDWIDEIILSIEIRLEQSQIKLYADISFGNGEIIFEICPVSMLYKNNLRIIDFEENFNTPLKLFSSRSIDYIHNALLVIQEKSINNNE